MSPVVALGFLQSTLAVDFFDRPVVIGVLFTVAAAVGAVARHLVGQQLNGDFPTGTLLVNLVASLALGVITSGPDPLPAVVGIGLLGALSTWSTAAVEVAGMARSGEGALAAGYLGLSVTGGILAAWVGLQIGPALF